MRTKPSRRTATETRLAVFYDRGPGEEIRINPVTVPVNCEQPPFMNCRWFDAATDDRGPAVPFIATWDRRESEWFPETQGVYMLELEPLYQGRWRLGFGSVSSPQSTLAALHRAYLELPDELKPHVRLIKRPCVFCADHPSSPGGSTIQISFASLPAPAKQSDKTYM